MFKLILLFLLLPVSALAHADEGGMMTGWNVMTNWMFIIPLSFIALIVLMIYLITKK